MKGFLSPGSGTAPTKSSGVDTLIGKQTEILGDVRFSGGLHLDGKVKGAVVALGDKAAALSVSETGAIEGDVRVPNIMLNGAVIGDVHASERLSLAARAKVNGNVYYKTLQMEPGAQVNGQLMYEETDGSATARGNVVGETRSPGESAVIDLHDSRRAKTA